MVKMERYKRKSVSQFGCDYLYKSIKEGVLKHPPLFCMEKNNLATSSSDFKSNHGHVGVIHQVFTDTPIKEMSNPFSAVRTHTN